MSHTANQHHVWQYYLKAWANKKDQIWCLQQGNPKPFSPNTRNVASERYFYEFRELSDVDMYYLNWLIERATAEELQKINRGWVQTFQMSFKLRNTVAKLPLSDTARDEAERLLVIMDKTLGEEFHGGAEERGKTSLNALRTGDKSFYRNDSEQTIHFIQFICLQFFRTAKMRNAMRTLPVDLPHDREKTWPIEAFIYASNISLNLFIQRKDYEIIIINNVSDRPFITGDQPIVNLLGTNDSQLALYYPLSPKRAMIFTANKERFPTEDKGAGALEVEAYSHKIYEMSDKQVFGNDRDYLASFHGMPKAILL